MRRASASAGYSPRPRTSCPPFWEPPHLHVCLSSYEGALTLAAVTRENAAPSVAQFLDALIDELPVAARG